jgi:riboflavin synthase
MFTGIVERLGKVEAIDQTPLGVKLSVGLDPWEDPIQEGESISVNGVCLTLLPESDDHLLVFDAMLETLRASNLGDLVVGSPVNLERAMRVGDRLGGHFVSGHVDTTGTVCGIEDVTQDPAYRILWVEFAPEWSMQMVPKGSVTIDGTSLTLVDVEENRFSVHLIPYTLEHTTLGGRTVGETVNLETDVIGKYVLKYASAIKG